MSHFTEIRTSIKDIGALRTACKEMGLSLQQQGTARGYNGQSIAGDYVIQLKGPYDAALQKQPDGSFALVADWWNGHVEKELGKKGGLLLQAYGVAAAVSAARKQGYSVSKKRLQDGSVHITLSVK